MDRTNSMKPIKKCCRGSFVVGVVFLSYWASPKKYVQKNKQSHKLLDVSNVNYKLSEQSCSELLSLKQKDHSKSLGPTLEISPPVDVDSLGNHLNSVLLAYFSHLRKVLEIGSAEHHPWDGA